MHANAGLSDRVDYLLPESTEKFTAHDPPKLLTVNVDLEGVIYSSLLTTRYFRQNPKDVQNPLLLLTSSGIGLYPGPAQPIYAAAKHGVTGLARSLAARWKEEENGFRCNALVPGLVNYFPGPIFLFATQNTILVENYLPFQTSVNRSELKLPLYIPLTASSSLPSFLFPQNLVADPSLHHLRS